MASTETVKLLGSWPSPFQLRARIALNIKSVAYEYIEEKLEAKSELLLESNPVYKKIPVLIHNQKPVCESLIIVQYIDEVWTSGPAIMPADPYDRAIHRFWAAYIDDKWFPNLRTIAAAQDDETRKAAIGEVEEGLGVLEGAFQSCSKGEEFFGGDKIGYLDITLGCFLAWIRVIETFSGLKLLDEGKVPGLAKWAQHFCADSGVKDVMPSTEKLAEFAKTLFTHMTPQS